MRLSVCPHLFWRNHQPTTLIFNKDPCGAGGRRREEEEEEASHQQPPPKRKKKEEEKKREEEEASHQPQDGAPFSSSFLLIDWAAGFLKPPPSLHL